MGKLFEKIAKKLLDKMNIKWRQNVMYNLAQNLAQNSRKKLWIILDKIDLNFKTEKLWKNSCKNNWTR